MYTDGRNVHHGESSVTLYLTDFFVFVTGSEHPPPLGFTNPPEVEFTDNIERTLPTASTCSMILYLSLHVTDYTIFVNNMDESIISSYGFGVV